MRAPDSELLRWTREKGCVVLTHDLDFGLLLSMTQETVTLLSIDESRPMACLIWSYSFPGSVAIAFEDLCFPQSSIFGRNWDSRFQNLSDLGLNSSSLTSSFQYMSADCEPHSWPPIASCSSPDEEHKPQIESISARPQAQRNQRKPSRHIIRKLGG